MTKSPANQPTVRQRLINAARTLFIERGFSQTSIDAITAQCKLTRGVFYNYFRSKRELYELALSSQAALLATESVEGKTGERWDEQLLATLFPRDRETGVLETCGLGSMEIPLCFFARDPSLAESDQAYTQALKTRLGGLLSHVNADLVRGESALLAITAMIVGVETIAKKLDDPYLDYKLRAACLANAAVLGQVDTPVDINDYFWGETAAVG